MQNPVGWFEIPVLDMDRAISFYEKILGQKLKRQQFGQIEMAFFPSLETGTGAPGSLVFHNTHYRPSLYGILIYFTSPSGDLQNELYRVAKAGGELLKQKTMISEDIGYMGLFLDTEGNRIAIHSRK